MRIAVVSFCLFVAAVANCQPPAVAPDLSIQTAPATAKWVYTPDKAQLPKKFQLKDLSSGLQAIRPVKPQSSLTLRDGASIDPKMIVRPPQTAVGTLPPGTPIAQNLYPGLVLQPIHALCIP